MGKCYGGARIAAKRRQHRFHRLGASCPYWITDFDGKTRRLIGGGDGNVPVPLADCTPGMDDEHSRKMAKSAVRSKAIGRGPREVRRQVKGADIGSRAAQESGCFGVRNPWCSPAPKAVDDEPSASSGAAYAMIVRPLASSLPAPQLFVALRRRPGLLARVGPEGPRACEPQASTRGPHLQHRGQVGPVQPRISLA